MHRLWAVRLAQHLLRGQLVLLVPPRSESSPSVGHFAPLVEAINSLEKAISHCEDILLVYAWDLLDPATCESRLQEALSDVAEVVSEQGFWGRDDPELENYCEYAWEGISRISPWLADAAMGAHKSPPPDLWRLEEFETSFEHDLCTPLSG